MERSSSKDNSTAYAQQDRWSDPSTLELEWKAQRLFKVGSAKTDHCAQLGRSLLAPELSRRPEDHR